ncbi:MAG: TonB-dependent receptor [Chitinophagaceae bacterium]
MLKMSRDIKRCLLMVVLLAVGSHCNRLSAQDKTSSKTITGTVVDSASGSPLQGVVVNLSRSKSAKATDVKGAYEIKAKTNDTLVFSHIGYNTVKVVVQAQTRVDIWLTQRKRELDEVIVIGYGSVKRKDVTGSVGQLDMDDVTKAPVASFDQAMAGRIAGVQVSSDEGQPGSEMNIVIRGGNSLTQSNAPLYVVDGFPIEDFSNASLSPDDIASVTVLKDASATAIYGARGANGVIIIETKKGKAGQPVITYNGYVGLQHATKRMDLMSPYEFVKYQLELDSLDMTNTYLTTPGKTLDDYKNVQGIDWQDLLFRTAFMHNHNLSLRGGTSQTKYSISGSVIDQDGVIINSGYRRKQLRVAVDQVINKKLKTSINVNYSRDKNYGALTSTQASSNSAYASYLMYRVWSYRPVSTGSTDIVDAFLDDDAGGDDGGSVIIMNPIVSTKNEIRQQTRVNLLANAGLAYTISKELSLNITGGYNNRLTKNEAFYNSKTYQGYASSVNTKGVNGSYQDVELTNWVNENTLNYKKRFDKNNQFDLLGGFTMQGTDVTTYGFTATNIPVSNESLGLRALQLGLPSTVTSIATRNTLVSFLGRANYTFKSRYLLTASFRVDGSSKFSKQNRWGYFPSGAFAWQMGDEKFLRNSKIISDAKLRVSYGLTGNNRIEDFARYLTVDLTDYYSFGNGTPGYAAVLDNLGNKNLKWESTESIDIGYDLSLFKNRIIVTLDAYRKTTKDLLLNANIPYSSGFSSAYKNVGSIRNDGLEITLNTINIQTKSFSWTSNFNISFNKNKVVALSENQNSILSTVTFTSDFNSYPLYIAQLGGPAAAFYGYVWDGNYQYSDFDLQSDGSYVLKSSVPTNGNSRSVIQPGDIKFVDQNGDGVVNDKDRVVIGRALPIHYGGFNNNFTYKGLSLNVFFQWSYGNDIMNANRIVFEGNFLNRYNINQFANYTNRWTPENQTNAIPRAGSDYPGGYSSRTMEDGSFIRLKTVQLTYAFPQRMVGALKGVDVYVAGQNLHTWTNYSGMDPEVSTQNSTLTPGFDYSAYARNLTVTFGVKVTF